MNILELSKNSTSGIKHFEEKPLSEWAVEFISEQKLSCENYGSAETFRSLSRRQKDAIRYQLRKGSVIPKTLRASAPIRPRLAQGSSDPFKGFNFLTAGKIALGIWISIFLLFDIVKIYLSKGASPLMAWQAAILVEICIVSASLSLRSQLRNIAYALFAYNVLLFAFMEIDQVFVNASVARANHVLLEEKRGLIKNMKAQLVEQMAESSKNLKRLDAAHARGFITSGSLAFERVSSTLKVSNSALSAEINTLESEVQGKETSQHSSSWMYITSILYFLLRCLLQFFSIHLLDQRKKAKVSIS